MNPQPYSISEFDIQSQIAELRRESAMRRIVYPKLIGRGQLTPDQADRQNTALLAAIETLRRVMDEREARTVDPLRDMR